MLADQTKQGKGERERGLRRLSLVAQIRREKGWNCLREKKWDIQFEAGFVLDLWEPVAEPPQGELKGWRMPKHREVRKKIGKGSANAAYAS